MPRTRYVTDSPNYMANFKLKLMSNVKTNKTTGCWEWTAYMDAYGYGKISMYGSRCMAHRASWITHRGPIPSGLCVLHRCDNPPCINPDHLWIGTFHENALDASRKGRLGHPAPNRAFTPDQVVLITRLTREGKLQKDIAKMFGVNRNTIFEVTSGKHYKDIPRI